MTLQEHFNAINKGTGNKEQFLKQARNLFPQYLTKHLDYNTSVNILKSKQIISEQINVVTKGFDIYDWKKILAEETKAEEKETSKEVKDKQEAYNMTDVKNADNINGNEIWKGYYVEMKDPANANKTGDELKKIVVKNLAKDPLYYTKNGMFGEKGLGYTDEAPGLGKNTQPTSKNASVLGGRDEVNSDSDIVKNSLVGSTKKNVKDTLGNDEAKTSMPKKVKEMPDKGVKGVEKKIKLKENITPNKQLDYEFEINNPETIDLVTKSAGITKKEYNNLHPETKIRLVKNAFSKLKEAVTGENPYFDTDPSDGDAEEEKNMRYGAENYYDKGLKAFKSGDFEKAQEYYEDALKFGSYIGWTEKDLAPYDSLNINENINKKYTHFAIRKSDGKIVNGWEYKNLDNESIKEYSKMDLKDQFPESKLSEFTIVTKKGVENKGMDPFDTKNWYKIDEVLNENEAIYQQLADLQDELVYETDPERKKEIEAKIQALEAGLSESKVRSLIAKLIKEELDEVVRINTNKKTQSDKKGKIPNFVFLPKEAITKINNKFPGSIQIASQDGKLAMFVSQLFYVALSGTTRGRYSQDIERKKGELTKYISEVIPSSARGLIKKNVSVNPTKVKETPMHYVNINLEPVESKTKEIFGEGIGDSKEKAETNARLDLKEKAKNKTEKITDIKRFTGTKGNFKCVITAEIKTEDGYLIPLKGEGLDLSQNPWEE